MFSHLSPRNQFALYGLGAMFLLGTGYVGARTMKPVPPMVIQTGAQEKPEVAKEIVVHVVGAVKRPGVVRLSSAQRVQDAIDLAGGTTANADLDRVNLAAKPEDGTQIRIPEKGVVLVEPVEPPITGDIAITPTLPPVRRSSPIPSPRSSRPKASKAEFVGKISLNTSTKAQLETLPGVGPSTAQKILDYRFEHGGFGSIDELKAVSGIGDKKLEKMRPYLKL